MSKTVCTRFYDKEQSFIAFCVTVCLLVLSLGRGSRGLHRSIALSARALRIAQLLEVLVYPVARGVYRQAHHPPNVLLCFKIRSSVHGDAQRGAVRFFPDRARCEAGEVVFSF